MYERKIDDLSSFIAQLFIKCIDAGNNCLIRSFGGGLVFLNAILLDFRI